MTYVSAGAVLLEEDIALACPECGRANLSHTRIIAYQRSEDRPWTQRTVIEGDVASSDTVIGDNGNPSRRRHGLVIEFSCEQCGDVGELTIAQHKGQTLIRWRRNSHAASAV